MVQCPEGAPAVGNTEISTKTNLFPLADQYIYNNGGMSAAITGDPAISRTLQQRLDENVSVQSFGVSGDNQNKLLYYNMQ